MRTWSGVLAVSLGVLAFVECASLPSNDEMLEHGIVRGVCYRVDGNGMPGDGSRPLVRTPLQIDLELMPAGSFDRARRVSTNAAGQFEFDWHPGEYYLQGVVDGRSSRSPDFLIRSGEITEVQVKFWGKVAF